jgi:hypothetical protein
MVGFFAGHARIATMLDQADVGLLNLLLPTTAIAEAQAVIDHTLDQWHALLFSPGVRSMPLSEHCAVEIGTWPGGLATRHTVHESQSMRAAVVTCAPGLYRGHVVSLLVV